MLPLAANDADAPELAPVRVVHQVGIGVVLTARPHLQEDPPAQGSLSDTRSRSLVDGGYRSHLSKFQCQLTDDVAGLKLARSRASVKAEREHALALLLGN